MPLAHDKYAGTAIKNVAVHRNESGAKPVPSMPSYALSEPPNSGSRRKRLWDLESHCHCPLVGVCLPIDTLRRLVNKALGASALANDYEVHSGAVSEAARRCKLSELMQAELDSRYVREIRAYKSAKDSQALAELWVRSLKAGDVAGAFWAALTHPRCEAALRDAMCKDLHMFQHQAGAGVRLEIARFNALADENALLGRELGKIQERMTRVMTEKNAELEQTQALLLQARADAIAKDTRLALMAEALESLRSSIQDLSDKERLQARLGRALDRQHELEMQNADLRRRVIQAERVPEEVAQGVPRYTQPVQEQRALANAPVPLFQKVVLCVGGRIGNVANYRQVVERVGGHFAHHDGGVEDNASLLDANLAAADLVICQTGCISHNAYWRVKDFCKRTGKQCVYVESASVSSLERELQALSTPSVQDVFPEGSS
ncbi:hypothetical protein AEP_00786 [Curvibacter sp. AEP1-3]|nr:hypothetical protein AEP_00786 [Curvibacter sp. AEP1-3]